MTNPAWERALQEAESKVKAVDVNQVLQTDKEPSFYQTSKPNLFQTYLDTHKKVEKAEARLKSAQSEHWVAEANLRVKILEELSSRGFQIREEGIPPDRYITISSEMIVLYQIVAGGEYFTKIICDTKYEEMYAMRKWSDRDQLLAVGAIPEIDRLIEVIRSCMESESD